MKSFILNAITVMCLSACLTAAEAQYLNYAAMHHQRIKRQMTDSTMSPEDEAYCGSLVADAYCSTGLAQGFIDADLSCGEGSEEYHRREANGCARNEKGKFCFSALALFDLGGIGQRNIEGNCSRVLQSNSCPSTCRTSLETFKSELGCCINTVVNGTEYRSGSAAVDYRVWQLCGVSLPAADCGNALDVNPPANVDNCSSLEHFKRRYTENLCLQSRGQPYVNAALKGGCDVYVEGAKFTVSLCSMNADNYPCGLDDGAVTVDSVCAGSNVTCRSACRDHLRNATINYGCCVNFHNTTVFGPRPLSLSYDVWRSCGLESPGFCESTLSLNSAVSTAKGCNAWWMTIVISLIIVVGAIETK